MSNESKIQYPTCKRCGRSNITADAFASWDHEKQGWTLTATLDTHTCEDCQDECHLEWKDGNPPDPPIGFPSIQETVIALLLVSDTNADEAVISKWTDEQRTLAYDWAMACHFHASDNDDVVVPPRPDFIPRKEPSDDF